MTGRRLVPGDAGSVAALAAAARSTARRLDHHVRELPVLATFPDAPRRLGRDLERRVGGLVTAVAVERDELAVVGDLLQEHAAHVTEDLRAVRSLLERGAQVGLELDGVHWRSPWGITGPADAGTVAGLEAERQALQRETDVVLHRVGRRRAALVRALRASTERLATEAARLRRG